MDLPSDLQAARHKVEEEQRQPKESGDQPALENPGVAQTQPIESGDRAVSERPEEAESQPEFLEDAPFPENRGGLPTFFEKLSATQSLYAQAKDPTFRIPNSAETMSWLSNGDIENLEYIRETSPNPTFEQFETIAEALDLPAFIVRDWFLFGQPLKLAQVDRSRKDFIPEAVGQFQAQRSVAGTERPEHKAVEENPDNGTDNSSWTNPPADEEDWSIPTRDEKRFVEM